jgi:glycerol-3-phosphate acyltransferase PlsY
MNAFVKSTKLLWIFVLNRSLPLNHVDVDGIFYNKGRLSMLVISLVVIILSYLVGSLSFAVLASRIFGLADPRTYGSKNPGATNVLRSGHKAAASLTLLGDAFKGWLVVAGLMTYLPDSLAAYDRIYLVALGGLWVMLGHIYPVFFKFKGGKGVATALGVLVGFSPWLGLISLVAWLFVAFVLKISSLAALCATIAASIGAFALFGLHPYAYATVLIALIVVLRHIDNIKRLIHGQEDAMSVKKDHKPK